MPSRARSSPRRSPPQGPSGRPSIPETATRSSPPGIDTRTGLSHQPRVTAAAPTATADDPEALVSPAPRSHTSTRITLPRVEARQLHVRPPGEPRVHLERRADSKEVVPREHVATHDRMRVADVDRNERHRSPAQVERLVLPHRRLSDLLPDEPPGNGGTDAPDPPSPPRLPRGLRRGGATPPRSGFRFPTSPRSSRRGSRSRSPRVTAPCVSTSTTPSLPIPVLGSQSLPDAIGRQRLRRRAARPARTRCRAHATSRTASRRRLDDGARRHPAAFDDVGRDRLRVALAVQQHDAGDPPHPLLLVARVARRPDDDMLERLVRVERGYLP